MKMVKSAAAAAVFALVAAAAFAQVSAQKLATAGTIGNDADNFMSVTDWNSVKFTKGFGFAGINSSSLELGFATKQKKASTLAVIILAMLGQAIMAQS